MLQHQQDLLADSHLNLQGKSEHHSYPRVESYLDSLCSPVASAFGEGHDSEARSEMRTHIESLIEANIELGDSREEAIEHALVQFGKVHTVKRAWKSSMLQEQRGSLRQSIWFALMFNLIAVAAAMTIVPIGVRFADDVGWRAASSIRELGIYALPAAAGLFTGMYAKRGPVLATLFALMIMLPPMISIDAWQTGSWTHSGAMIGRLNQLAIFLMSWLPFGCAGAGVGSLIRWMLQRRERPVVVQ